MFEKAVRFLFAVLTLVLVVDPGDRIFHAKTSLFGLILLVWLLDKLVNRESFRFRKDIAAAVGVILLVPLWGLFGGLIQGTFNEDRVMAMGYIKSFSVIVLIFVVYDKSIPVLKYLCWCCLAIPLIIIPVYIISLNDLDTFKVLYQYLNFEKDVAKFALRNFYGFQVLMFYYRTSPLLVFPIAFFFYRFLKNKTLINLILTAAFLTTMFFSGTRANLLSGFFVLIMTWVYFLYYQEKKFKLFALISLMMIGVVMFVQSLDFSGKESSEAVKSGHMYSYDQLFSEHPSYLIWGQGLGSTFYSKGFRDFTSQTELTYMELIRIFGVPVTLVFLFFLLYPTIFFYANGLFKKHHREIVAYFGYLFIVGTNPLLVSSTGILAIITMYSLMNRSREENGELTILTA